ncbi:NAD(+)/NADH kinase [Herpetosiphon sp. NSE202]|uniref:NAD(+)/NADH kinase n=1 Tax=Herpetosiphon sp. NSE202 TaxID=3351349 RepID=UPI0036301D11
MTSVAIIANPASSKDIRRVVSHASSVSNNEKTSIVRRVLQGLAATPIDEVWYLPDHAGIVRNAAERQQLPFGLLPFEGQWHDHADDTTLAARLAEQQGIDCLITLGGDGTARAAIKGARSIPILALSTGTNNAFPQTIEPTLAGLAAGSVACFAPDAINRHALLEIYRNHELLDIALVDVASVADSLGGRAVWEISKVQQVVTTRLTPGTVGLSAIGGHAGIAPAEAQAVHVLLGAGRSINVPIAPGMITPVPIAEHSYLPAGQRIALRSGAIALDGEREWMARAGEDWQVGVIAEGVITVDLAAALAAFAKQQAR